MPLRLCKSFDFEQQKAIQNPFEAVQKSCQYQDLELLHLPWEGLFPACFSHEGSGVAVILHDFPFRQQNLKI